MTIVDLDEFLDTYGPSFPHGISKDATKSSHRVVSSKELSSQQRTALFGKESGKAQPLSKANMYRKQMYVATPPVMEEENEEEEEEEIDKDSLMLDELLDDNNNGVVVVTAATAAKQTPSDSTFSTHPSENSSEDADVAHHDDKNKGWIVRNTRGHGEGYEVVSSLSGDELSSCNDDDDNIDDEEYDGEYSEEADLADDDADSMEAGEDEDDDSASIESGTTADLLERVQTRLSLQHNIEEIAKYKEVIERKDAELENMAGQLRRAIETKCDLVVAHQELEQHHERDLELKDRYVEQLKREKDSLVDSYAEMEKNLLSELVKLTDEIKSLKQKHRDELEDWERMHRNEMLEKNFQIAKITEELRGFVGGVKLGTVLKKKSFFASVVK